VGLVDVDGDGVVDGAVGDSDGDGVPEVTWAPGAEPPPGPPPVTPPAPAAPLSPPSLRMPSEIAGPAGDPSAIEQTTAPDGTAQADTDGDGRPDVWDRDDDGYFETARVDEDGDGIPETTYVDSDADGHPDGLLVGGEPGSATTGPAAVRVTDLAVQHGVFRGPSGALLRGFLGDPSARRVEVMPDLSPRSIAGIGPVEVWPREAEALPRGGALVGLETRFPDGSSVGVDILVRVRDGRLSFAAVGAEGSGLSGAAQAELVDRLLGAPAEQINGELARSGRVLTGVTFDAGTGRFVIEAAPAPP
jgi:hypothetical protein